MPTIRLEPAVTFTHELGVLVPGGRARCNILMTVLAESPALSILRSVTHKTSTNEPSLIDLEERWLESIDPDGKRWEQVMAGIEHETRPYDGYLTIRDWVVAFAVSVAVLAVLSLAIPAAWPLLSWLFDLGVESGLFRYLTWAWAIGTTIAFFAYAIFAPFKRR